MKETLSTPYENVELPDEDEKHDPQKSDNETNSSVKESVRNTLLKQLPHELQERWKDADIKQVMEIIDARKEAGYETLTGYHTSNIDMNVGDYIRPSQGTVHYTTSLENLYGKKVKYLYIVEGSNDDIVNDEELGWRESRAGMKIIDKIELTPKKFKELEASFADVEYS